MNTILSGSSDRSVRLWDIRSGQQTQVFNGHRDYVYAVEYSPFVINNSDGSPNVLCSGSLDNTIRFWDIRSSKKQLYAMKLDEGIGCLKYIGLKKKINDYEQKSNGDSSINLCYGSKNGSICIWG
ncbi:hypothetical protein RFI_28513 [Reticulomyxa filosa]|uniref:Uncharacterized protein n=1 Tax=Reticulomyxa filosa TaxID=46433 RepID=X6M4Q8_RETFI|nr:hypothetical protein RFI_28513 [Reticulomyxa filosa]|eukprot:ETO08874.1 hypothetical protein RFI_28513 [Reticulomyxa filosa]